MATCSYSTILEHSADSVWAAVRRFDRYEWAGNVREIYIENGMPASTVGAIRCVSMGFARTRQRLLAYSETDRSYTYGYCDPSPLQQFRVTLHVVPATVIPTIHGDRASVAWQATYECPAWEEARWNALLSHSFARSLESLKKHLAGNRCSSSADLLALPAEEDHRSSEERDPSPMAPYASERDAEWLWKTVLSAARAN